MNSDNDIYSQKESWLGRLGGIIITKFRQLSIAEVDCINCTISLWESGYSTIVQIYEDGYLKWDKFDDTDIGRSKIAYESGENFYKPFIIIAKTKSTLKQKRRVHFFRRNGVV